MRYQTPAYGSFETDTGLLGWGVTFCVMEHQHHTQQVYGLHTFFMVYGAEVVLPSDIRHDSPRKAAYMEANNEQARREALDLLDEKHDLAAAASAIYQQDMRRYDSRQVKSRTFQEGDLVLRLIQDQTDAHIPHLGKGPLWSARI